MFRTLLTAIFAVIFASAALADDATEIQKTVRALAPNGLVLVVDQNGNPLVSQNADKPFTPASVAKVVTAWLAMETLGADYRFKTSFYLSDDNTLYVRGGGDPFLVSEELALLVRPLLDATGNVSFKAIRLDTSYFPNQLIIPGIEDDGEAYNALNAALAANFNTIAAVREGDTVRSGEEQTPITPLAIAQFKARGPNGKGRISVGQDDPDLSALYVGELLAAFIEQAGGSPTTDIAIGLVPDGLMPVYTHEQSRPLSELMRLMLLGSNNYIANQIFLEVGAKAKGAPASLEKSIEVLSPLLVVRGLSDAIQLVEGSGISPDNQFTALGLVSLLGYFAPHAELMTKSRRGSRYKTGTLDDVSTLAGYAITKEHGMARFVIALPGGSGKLRFRILAALEKGL